MTYKSGPIFTPQLKRYLARYRSKQVIVPSPDRPAVGAAVCTGDVSMGSVTVPKLVFDTINRKGPKYGKGR